MEQRLSCSSSASGGEVNHEDEYHDDGLPDLVLAAGRQLSTADQDAEDSDDEAKRKRSCQVRTGLEEKLMVLGERTEGRASEIEDKIGRLAKKSMQQFWTAVSSSAGSSENGQLCQSPNMEGTQPNIY